MKNLYIRLLRLMVHTVGRLSDGIALCLNQGLTSGKMLDYIYRNKASGRLLIGKFIDRSYLSHPGWECIRIRKKNLEELLHRAVNLTYEQHEDVFILDVASGPALYILDVLTWNKGKNIHALCRDLDERWLHEGRLNADELGLHSVIYEKGDALDMASFVHLKSRPDICVSSGFYDWIMDDHLIKKSLKIIYDLLPTKGYFVFTIQTGHVDMKMVSEIFSDFNKKPLRMTVRPVDLVCGWVQEMGFDVLETRQDRGGYYAVTLAQKN
jgi:SAM-dependent methyltransferase